MESSEKILVGAVGASREELDALARNLEAVGLKAGDLRVFSGLAVETVIDVESDEAQVLLPLERALVTALDAVFLYRADESVTKELRIWAAESNFWLFDLRGGEDSLWADPGWSAGALAKAGPLLGIPGPDAFWCAQLIRGLEKFSPKAPLCYMFLPASERGSDGVRELFQQSANALSLQSKPGETLAFSMLPEPFSGGSSAAFKSAFGAIAGQGMSPERIVLRVPVFHMAALSVTVGVSDPAKACRAAEKALKDAGFSISKGKKWPVAGVSSAELGLIARVSPIDKAVWAWMVYDCIRDGKSTLAVKMLAKLAWAES